VLGRLGWIQIDCADPERLAGFWSAVLGLEIGASSGDPVHYLDLVPARPGEPTVGFQRVPEGKVVKNRLHLDVVVDDVDAATAAALALGATRPAREDVHEYGYNGRLLLDPEGNELCFVYA
jgi:predicted enzyme related to lactoylglutathione lyase